MIVHQGKRGDFFSKRGKSRDTSSLVRLYQLRTIPYKNADQSTTTETTTITEASGRTIAIEIAPSAIHLNSSDTFILSHYSEVEERKKCLLDRIMVWKGFRTTVRDDDVTRVVVMLQNIEKERRKNLVEDANNHFSNVPVDEWEEGKEPGQWWDLLGGQSPNYMNKKFYEKYKHGVKYFFVNDSLPPH